MGEMQQTNQGRSLAQQLESRGVDPQTWHVLKNVVWPDAQSDKSRLMALDYCRARRLDPMKKPVHIVPVFDRRQGTYVDSYFPSIQELRTTAMRTGEYAGREPVHFGPTVERNFGGEVYEIPEWAQVTVYRIIGGQSRPFPGAPVFWEEAYASTKDGKPNSMWAKRRRGQLAKVAEAEALRAAFPEELGTSHAAEEMEGQALESDIPRTEAPAQEAGAAAKRLADDETAPPEPGPAPEPESAESPEGGDSQGVQAKYSPDEPLVPEWADFRRFRMDIGSTDLPSRVQTALVNAGYQGMNEVVRQTPRQLAQVPRLGRKGLETVIEWTDARFAAVGQEPPEAMGPEPETPPAPEPSSDEGLDGPAFPDDAGSEPESETGEEGDQGDIPF